MKKVMVLGAGVMQVPLIKKIREMGHYALVVGIKGNYPGIPLASRCEFLDFNETDKVIELGRREKIDAVLTCGIDMPVKTMACVAEALSLPGISAMAGRCTTNKMLMKECFQEYGVRTARFIKCESLEDGVEAFRQLNKPVMFKTIDGQGSNGITKVSDESQIQYAYDAIKKFSRTNKYIVEEFIEGEEIGAQAFVLNGKIQFVLPHGDYVFQGDTGVPLGHYVPAGFSDAIVNDCRKQLELCIKAMGLSTCAVNADFILHDGEIYVLEIAGRCGATMLAETVSIYYGFNYYEKMIQAALGEQVDFTPCGIMTPNATMTLYSEKDGIILSQKNNNPIGGDVIEVRFDHEIGDAVRKFSHGIDRLGHVIVKGRSLEEAQANLDNALKNIEITVG